MLSVISVLLLGRGFYSWMWLTIFFLIILTIGIIHDLGFQLPVQYNRYYEIFFFTACLIGVPVCTFLISLIFDKENKATIKLLEQNKELLNTNEEKNLIIKEIHHRVKNNLQIISSLINLQTDEITDPKTIEILKITRSRIFALSLIHQKIFTGKNIGTVNFKEYLNDLIQSQKNVYYEIESSITGDDVDLNLDMATPMSLIVSELTTNSFKHAFKEIKSPRIDMTLTKGSAETYELKIRDNGIGLPSKMDVNNSHSLGLEIINSLIEQIDASIRHTESGSGTEFIILFNPHLQLSR
ncbi:MAG: signal transduction histidine kinase [Bacteroidetes bacterium]|jgi:two-component sensor histidine kinase|nr:signal transduction histidine kinase [Bacteroidota bacterium]